MAVAKKPADVKIPSTTSARSARMVKIPVGIAGRSVLGIGKQLVCQSS